MSIGEPKLFEKRALFIACLYKGTAQALDGCNHDQEHLVNYVQSIAPDCEIRVLTDDNSINLPSGLTVYGSSTHHNITAGLHWLRQAKQMWFSYSGHGSSRMDKSSTSEEIDHRDETIVPTDWERAGQISDDTMRRELVDHLTEGSRLTALFDCCHSGTALDLRVNYLDQSKSTGFPLFKKYHYDPKAFQRVLVKQEHPRCALTKASVCMLSGCRDEQTSADATIKGEYTGAMTFAFLYFSDPKQPGYALRGKDEKTIGNLLQDMNGWLFANDYEQRPQLSFGNDSISVDEEWKPFI